MMHKPGCLFRGGAGKIAFNLFCCLQKGSLSVLFSQSFQLLVSSVRSVSGYRHVYLEGIEEASIFVHVAINDICGKVSADCGAQHSSCTAAHQRALCRTREAPWVKVQAITYLFNCSKLPLHDCHGSLKPF